MAHTHGQDITPLQFALLAGLAQSPDDVDQITLAQRAALDTSTAASALDRMEAKGWIERRLDSADRRRRVLHMTVAGNAQLRRVRASIANAQTDIISPLTEKERATFLALLEKLARND